MKIREYLKQIYYLSGSNKKQLAIIIFLFIFTSTLDLIGIGTISIYASLIVSPEIIYNSSFIDSFNYPIENIPLYKLAIITGGFLVFIFFIKFILSIATYYKIFYFTQNCIKDIRFKILNTYKKLPYEEYIYRDSSITIASVGIYVKAYGAVLNGLLLFIGDMIVATFIFILLFFASGPILLALVSILAFTIYLYKIFYLDSSKLLGIQVNSGLNNIYRGIQEFFSGFKEIRILNNYFYFDDKIINGTELVAKSETKQAIITAIPRLLLEFVIILFIVSLIFVSMLAGVEFNSIVPIVSLFAAAALRVAPMLNQITRFFGVFKYGEDSINRIYKEVSTLNNPKSSENKISKQTDLKAAFKLLKIDNVSYSYPKNEFKVLENISFEIQAGDTIAIIGESGSGKTTLINLILGLLNPSKGKILLNDLEIQNCLRMWQDKVAYLPQDVFLIQDTIIKNIALGEDPKLINLKKIEMVVKQAQLFDFICELPNGLKTEINENGINLSGGQKQRIALARAFYFDKEILMFDEATSALDSRIESEIMNQINNLKGSKTIIMISHRQETITYCDKIFRIKNGRIELEK